MEVRNLCYNKCGTIDCEILHEDFGWIPFTASPHDNVGNGAEVYESAISGDYGDIEPYMEVPPTEAQYKAIIAERRYKAETAGVTVNGVSVYTDRTTQNKLTATSVRAQRDPSYKVKWKQTDNTFVELTAEQIIMIGDVVGDYVQECYTRESELIQALVDGLFTEEMLTEGWPNG
jgi:hypothetical protein